MVSEVHSQGWLSVTVPVNFEYKAKMLRADRDQRYGNIFTEHESDERWVGDLGEIVFKSWLNNEGMKGKYEWIMDDAAGKPDFIISPNIRVGVKTVKRKVAPRAGYTAQITAKHAKEPTDYFFFMSYEYLQKKMWLLGGIPASEFLNVARYYSAGEWVHSNYQIRPGHEIYNADISALTAPNDWIVRFK